MNENKMSLLQFLNRLPHVGFRQSFRGSIICFFNKQFSFRSCCFSFSCCKPHALRRASFFSSALDINPSKQYSCSLFLEKLSSISLSLGELLLCDFLKSSIQAIFSCLPYFRSINSCKNEGVSKWTHPLFTPPFTLSTT